LSRTALLLLYAERIEREISALDIALSGVDGVVSGTVRVTSVPIIVNHILVPAAKILLKHHPHLQLEFVADAREISVSRVVKLTWPYVSLVRKREEQG
jgi:DNA-binding transcriptional LysR family regulator